MEREPYDRESAQQSSVVTDLHHHSHRPEIETAPDIPPAPPKRALTVAGIVVLALILGGVLTLVARSRNAKALARETEQNAIPNVTVVHPLREKADEDLALPSTLQPFQESPIYARTNGYLLKWTRDIGSKIAKGELLARIDTPEIDQELMQARATRQQIAAQMQLAQTSAQRWQNLRTSDAVSQQEADTQVSGFEQAKANLAAAEANVRRLEQMESFKNVYAPFSGVLTRRNVDVGALINAGAGGRELFVIAQVDPIRVFVNVPQAYASAIRVGMLADIELQEIPGKRFQGKVTRTAEAIDPGTRTLLTQVEVPNKGGQLLPGSYAQVRFRVNVAVPKLTVPVNTMLFRAEGTRVAVVDPNGTVKLRPITIGRDYGAAIQVLGGLAQTDQVVVNPADSLEDGQKVNVAATSTPNQKQGASRE